MGDQMTDGPDWQGVRILVEAQRQADLAVADARMLAAQVLEDARVLSLQVAGDAAVHRDKVLAEAQDDASRIREQAAEDASRMLVETRAKAPLEAQARYAYYRALGDALSAQMLTTLASLQAVIEAYEAQEEPVPPVFTDTARGLRLT